MSVKKYPDVTQKRTSAPTSTDVPWRRTSARQTSLNVGPSHPRRHLTSDITPPTLSFSLSLRETQKPSRCSSFPREFPPAMPFPTPSRWVSKGFRHQTCWGLIMGWFYAFRTDYFSFSSPFAAFWDSSHLLFVPIWPAVCGEPRLPLKVCLSIRGG